MKSERQKAIIELITKYDIETQEDMISHLRALGYDVTQATVSRDIRELQLTKMLSNHGSYKYVKNSHRAHSGNVKFNTAVVESITSVDYSDNIVVLKTYPGLGMAVASGVDSLNVPNILGCIGGDDTIMIVTSGKEASRDISAKIKEMMKSF